MKTIVEMDALSDEQFFDYLASDEFGRERRGGDAPEATYNAAVYQLRTGGEKALDDPDCVRRLAELSDRQLLRLIDLATGRGAPDRLLDRLAAMVGDDD